MAKSCAANRASGIYTQPTTGKERAGKEGERYNMSSQSTESENVLSSTESENVLSLVNASLVKVVHRATRQHAKSVISFVVVDADGATRVLGRKHPRDETANRAISI